MTPEEIVWFALMLGESDRVRAMIAEDETPQAETTQEDLLADVPPVVA